MFPEPRSSWKQSGRRVARCRLARNPKLRMRIKPRGSKCRRKRRRNSSRAMSPRPYHMGKREVAAAETRARILDAARQLLANESKTDLGMEAIARRADVSRLTLYYQFKSRPGLLEALYDHLAIMGNMLTIAQVFHEPAPAIALEKRVRTFVGFWSSDPVVIRRLRGMSTLDIDIDQGIRP